MRSSYLILWIILTSTLNLSCQEDKPVVQEPEKGTPEGFYFGADLSYVNQILDKGGAYKDRGTAKDPYTLFADRGMNLVRLRLWHTPSWTRDIYDGAGTQMYNDLADVERAIRAARQEGMQVLLDFHYSDDWADPGKQKVPQAWRDITSLEALVDSVYNYTFSVLSYLNGEGLMPELVQLGNETNCGMLYTDAPAGFPSCNVCGNNPKWSALGQVINAAVAAVNEVKLSSSVDTKILLHIAEPQHVAWWFENLTTTGGVSDFDMIGFSWYPLWHTGATLGAISTSVAEIRQTFGKPVLVLETAYPWTTEAKDSYTNLFGAQTPLSGFPFTKDGQRDLMIRLVQEVIDGGGSGVVYWEPAWISIPGLKDQWGEGSAWENATFFDFNGEALQVFDFATHEYELD